MCLGICLTASIASYAGPDYERLPLDTIFPGPWESNIRAPSNKSYIAPAKIYHVEGAVSGAEAVLQDANSSIGKSWVISPGGLITFEFAENIGGRYIQGQPCEDDFADRLAESALMSKV